MNLAALGVSVSLVSLVGDDEAGDQLRTKLTTAGVNVAGVHSSKNYETTTKVRILAGQAHSNRQQVIRIDYEADRKIDDSDRQLINSNLTKALSEADALIISDYNYGVADESVINLLRRREQSVPTLIDSRFSLSEFGGFTAATPNEDEVEHLVDRPISSTEDLENAAIVLCEQLRYDALLVTRGAHGMLLLQKGTAPLHISAVGAQQAVDVTGAGDTVIATFATALASGGSYADAAHLANFAGGLVVMKRGTASVSAHELEHSITHYEPE
jgi:rfaE bifunctional protein kinase chain/domain